MVMMKGLLLDTRIAFSNRLCDLQVWLEERQHPAASRRVQRFRCWLDRAWCRLLGHPRIIYGPMRDICLDCLTIVDEHPDGRGHEPDPQRKGMPKCPRCGDIATLRIALERAEQRELAASAELDEARAALDGLVEAASAGGFGFCDRTDRREACNLPDCAACNFRAALTAAKEAGE